MSGIDNSGEHLPVTVRQFNDWWMQARCKRAGVPVNISGHTFRARVYTNDNANASLVLNLNPSIVDAAAGIHQWLVPRGDAIINPGTYWWYWDWYDTDLDKRYPIASGPFIVKRWRA